MSKRLLHATALTLVLAAAFPARAQTHRSKTASSGSASAQAGSDPTDGGDGSSEAKVPGAVSSGWVRYRGPFYIATATPSGIVYTFFPPPFGMPVVVGPGNVGGPLPAPLRFDKGTVAPLPPPGLIRSAQPERPVVQVRRSDINRSSQLVTLGDRMFRIANWKRAEERYLQAARLDPRAAAPRARLAQIALVREQYREAADRLREAEIAQPGWIVTAPDVQALYAEPADFARYVAKLESHLHAHPDDRDAWLVLGAQWYLSGRAGRAADVFLRLDDPHRRPDLILAAFLDATNHQKQSQPARPTPIPPDPGDPFKAPDREP
ncbi:MAG: tetratricopeptide repeat protein [Paludisphaera borealis]|uniref:tetratricopeptide repeat protein n=1 Tax=Paludisphaera borealis TaxID=1387353 RepID=UPI00283EFFE3|nr:tetratricopeptide repeat protein [Paludisphaera borealis]MDR3620258.1 tetratricopeptide repeat protein [Paludisphaera borealis]